MGKTFPLVFITSLLICLTLGWEPGTQYTYRYTGRSAAGIYRLKLQNAVIELQSRVVVQCIDYSSVIIKLTENRIKRNGNYLESPYFGSEKGHPGEIDGDEDEIFNRELLSAPFLISYDAGSITSVQIGADDPQWVINLKKSIASQLQLDLSGVRYDGPPLNVMAPEEGTSISFPVYEDSITGNCSVTLSVSKLRKFQIDASDATEISSFGAVCNGKPVYQIVKTKDYDKCQRSPTSHHSTSNFYSCTFDKANCGEFMQRTSLYKYLACGSNYPNLVVVHASGFTDLVAQPFATMSDELVNSVVVTWSIEKMEKTNERFTLPSVLKEHTSLVYSQEEEEPVQLNQHKEYSVPSLFDAPVKSKEPISIVHNNIIDALKMIGRDLKDSADAEKDNLERLVLITRLLSMFSLGDLRSLWYEVKLQSPAIQALFVDCAVVAGSNPTVMLIKELIETQEISGFLSDFAISSIGHYIRNPTREIIPELINLLKSNVVQSSKTKVQTTLMAIANLWSKICSFGSKDVQTFCDRKNDTVVKDFISTLVHELESSSDAFDRIVVLSALGSLGVEEILPILIPIIRGTPKKFDNTAERLQSVLSLCKLVKTIPEKVYPILVSLASNFGERPEIRMASLELLLTSNAQMSVWQKFAASTWFDSSQQMQSFVYTLIYSLTQLPPSTPLFRDLIQKARIALLMAKPFSFGLHSSFANIRSTHLDDSITVIMNTVSFRNSDQSLPVYLNHRYYHQLGPLERKPISISMFNFNMKNSWNELLNEYLEKISGKDDVTVDDSDGILKELWMKLNAAVKPADKTARFLHVKFLDSINHFINLDKLDVNIRKYFNAYNILQGKRLEVNSAKFVMLSEQNVHFVTELGLPMRYQLTMPLLTAAHGMLDVDKNSGIKTDLNVEMSLKLRAELRVDFPFNGNYIATGVDVLVSSHLPIKMSAHYVKGDLQLGWIPSDKVADLFHYHVKPYTITRNEAVNTKPTFEDPAAHLISVIDNPIQRDIPIADKVGVDLRFLEHSELAYSDKLSWNEYISKIDLNLIFNLGFVPTDIRYRKYVIRYNPSETRSRSFSAKIFHQYASKTNTNTVFIESGSSHPKRTSSSEIVSYNPIINEFHPLLGRLFGSLESGGAHMLMANLTIVQDGGTHINIDTLVGMGVNDRYNKDMVDWQTEYSIHSSQSPKKVDYTIRFATTRNWDSPPAYGLSQRDLTLNQVSQLAFGPACEHKINLTVQLSRDQETAKAALDSSVGQQCYQDMKSGFKHGSPSCTEARALDHTYNIYNFSVESENMPNSWLQLTRRNSIWMNNILEPFIVKHVHGQTNPENRSSWNIRRDPLSGDSSMEFIRPHETVIAENVRWGTMTSRLLQLVPVLEPFSTILFPMSASSNLYQKSKSITSAGISDAKCYVGSNAVYTFDGVHYNYTVDECTHVLLTDCYQKSPFAVLVEKGSDGQKIVAVIYGRDTFVLDPTNDLVTINKVKIHVSSLSNGSHIEIRSTKLKSIQAIVFPIADGGVVLDVRSLSFSIKVQGSHVELSAPVHLRGRSCGLCGDFNQDVDDEFKTPGRCSLFSGDLMAASFKLKTGKNCSNLTDEVSRRLKEAVENCQSVDQQFLTYLPDYS